MVSKEKNIPSNTEKKAGLIIKSSRIQTAEGWKRSMIKKRKEIKEKA